MPQAGNSIQLPRHRQWRIDERDSGAHFCCVSSELTGGCCVNATMVRMATVMLSPSSYGLSTNVSRGPAVARKTIILCDREQLTVTQRKPTRRKVAGKHLNLTDERFRHASLSQFLDGNNPTNAITKLTTRNGCMLLCA